MTTLCTEGTFGIYNRDQVVPSARKFKYLSSHNTLEWAMKSAKGLGFRNKREILRNKGPLDRRTRTTASTSSPFWARAHRNWMLASKPYEHAQYRKLVLVVILFLRSKGLLYEHRDDCQIPLKYAKRKDGRAFIEESLRLKKEAKEMRDFCRMYGKSVKVCGVRQIYEQRPRLLLPVWWFFPIKWPKTDYSIQWRSGAQDPDSAGKWIPRENVDSYLV